MQILSPESGSAHASCWLLLHETHVVEPPRHSHFANTECLGAGLHRSRELLSNSRLRHQKLSGENVRLVLERTDSRVKTGVLGPAVERRGVTLEALTDPVA